MLPRLLAATAVTGISGLFTEGFILLAQSSDPISGGAGWIGAGLLGLVLSWVFFWHLPAKDKQVKEIIEGCDAHNEKIAQSFRADLNAAREQFGSSLKLVTEQADRHMQTLATAIVKEIQHLREHGGMTQKEAYDKVLRNRATSKHAGGGGARE